MQRVKTENFAGIITALILISGCGQNSVPSLPQGLVNPEAAAQVKHSGSWMLPEAKHEDLVYAPDNGQHTRGLSGSRSVVKTSQLLFISDTITATKGSVDILTTPGMKFKRRVKVIGDLVGLCSDASANVWMTNNETFQTTQISRTGKVLKQLADHFGLPYGCAINPKNGDLAVTNVITLGSPPPALLVYPGASGTPKPYFNADLYGLYFAGYDPSGDLFVDGTSQIGAFSLAELPAGGNKLMPISITGETIYEPGMVQWYTAGNYLAVGDQNCRDLGYSCIYWLAISGSTATITGRTDLERYDGRPACAVIQGVITTINGTSYLAGGDYEGRCGRHRSSVDLWAFPAGGIPTNYNNTAHFALPAGAAVSSE
ncbi:MAG TPA: hypothetical protein VGI19_19220 [Candidatus Cybelea sp.]|jgi:hypothetical protein